MIVEAPIADELERHRGECRCCTPWSVCPVAAALLERLTQAIAPMPKPRGQA